MLMSIISSILSMVRYQRHLTFHFLWLHFWQRVTQLQAFQHCLSLLQILIRYCNNGDQPSEPKRSICSVCKVDWNLIRSIIPIILVIGDWSKGSSHLRNSSPTPNMRLKRLLAKHFRLYEIDECYTSKRHWRTEEICGNLFCPDSTGQSRKVHRVLTFQTSNNRLGCINRDNNACHNMRKLYNWYISYCKGEPGYTVPRPPAYMLSGTNHPAVMQSAPQDQSNRTVAYRPLL